MKSVSIIPALPPPIAEAYARAISLAFPDVLLCIAIKVGTPLPLTKVDLTKCHGLLGAIMNTS